jgi:hypothetical protein
MVQGNQGKKQYPILKVNQSKMGWRHNLNDREPEPAQNSEFKFHTIEK